MDRVVFTKDFLEQVRQENDIVEVASEYFTLEEKGGNYVAHCTHAGGDKTPSLTFYVETQTFYCFACHIGSKRNPNSTGPDIISFLQWVENIPFQEAVIMLAQRANLEIPTVNDPEFEEKKRLYESVLKTNRQYWSNLYEKSCENVHEYLLSRNITEEDMSRWRLGATFSGRRDLVAKPVYAIMDEQGRTCGFSYRTDHDSKYMNSKNSPIFSKRNILYGLNFIKKEIREHNYIVLVEGFHDTIQLQKYGVPAAGLMSTAITKEHLDILRRYTKNVILFMDGDEPGMENTLQNIDLLQENGFMVEVVSILRFDPDEIAIKYKEDIMDFIYENKCLPEQFKLNRLYAKYFNQVSKFQKEMLDEAHEILTTIKSPTDRKIYEIQIENLFKLVYKGGDQDDL